MGGVTVRRDWAKAHPDAVLALLKGYRDAIRFIREHPRKTQAVAAHYLKLTDPGLLQATYDRYATAFQPVPEVSEASLLEAIHLMQVRGAPDVKTLYDNSYMEQLKAQGFFRQLYPSGIPSTGGRG